MAYRIGVFLAACLIAGGCGGGDPDPCDAAEICDGADNDCDGLTDGDDDSLTGAPSLYLDDDGDGFGEPGDAVVTCELAGRVPDATDCDDTLATVHPGAADDCGSPDNDCDGAPDPTEGDADLDGTSACAGDCDDTTGDIGPAAAEVCSAAAVDEDCDGLLDADDPSADAWTCGYCPPWDQWDEVDVVTATYNPCVISETAVWGCSTNPEFPDTHTFGERLHRVGIPAGIAPRPQLLLWLPPGPGKDNQNILKMATYAGYRSILVGYPNEELYWGVNCLGDFGTCYADGRQEILWGDDTSPYIELGFSDSAIGRTVELLQFLDAADPSIGWGAYVNAAGDDLVWEDVVMLGWSEGATNLGWLVHEVEPYAAIFISGPEDAIEDPEQPLATYMYEPFATPGCAMYGAYQVYEQHGLFDIAWDLMEIPGAIEIFEETPFPWHDSHRLATRLEDFERDDCTAHKAMALDYCMNDALAEAYVHFLCEAGSQDRVVECPFTP